MLVRLYAITFMKDKWMSDGNLAVCGVKVCRYDWPFLSCMNHYNLDIYSFQTQGVLKPIWNCF